MLDVQYEGGQQPDGFWRERSPGYKVTFDAKFWQPFFTVK